jgi:NAD(P)-dependent dehydrogenase (short-subunit alcohol dehydrogenase family)
MERLENKVALVSGAASGIGAAVVDRLVEEGATVVAADIAEIEDGVICDVTDPESCAAAIAETLERHDQLDILVNVAGIGAGNRIEDVTPQEWRKLIEVNLTGTFFLSQAALPALLETTGAIVNMASLSGIRGTPYNAPTRHRRAASSR